jgi:predicted Zn-dependent protease
MNETGIQCGYFDGQSAAEQSISVEFLTDGLVFQPPGTGLMSWSYEDLRLISVQRDNGHVTLGWTEDDTLRMRIKSREASDQLFRLAPHLRADRPEKGVLKPVMVSGAIVAVLAILYFSYPVFRQAIILSLPDSWAQDIGDTLGQGSIGSASTCMDPQGQIALRTLITRLTKGVAMPYEMDISVVDAPVVNAFAAPGGRVVLFRGLLDEAKSVDEVAGVLAHEIGHVLHRHPLKRVIDVYGFELVLTSLGGNIGGYSSMLLMMSYSRDDEREADDASLSLLRQARISSDGYANFFERLEEKQAFLPDVMNFLSTHPLPEEREDTIREGADAGPTTPALNDTEWQALKNICGSKKKKRKDWDGQDEEIINI